MDLLIAGVYASVQATDTFTLAIIATFLMVCALIVVNACVEGWSQRRW